MKIEVFFDSYKKANEAVAKLKEQGFNSCYVDLNQRYDDDRNMQTNLPGTEPAPSLSGLVLRGGDPYVERSKGPLAAADPMVSGMAGFEEVCDVSCRVIADVNDKDTDRAKVIATKAGGFLYNPNVKRPDYPDDIL